MREKKLHENIREVEKVGILSIGEASTVKKGVKKSEKSKSLSLRKKMYEKIRKLEKKDIKSLGMTSSVLSSYNNKQTNNTLFRSVIHTYFKSLRYNRNVHQQLEISFIYHYTSSGKINQTKYCKC